MAKNKLICDQIIDRLKKVTEEVLEEFSEPDFVSISVGWNVGQNDFPFGIIVTRPDEDKLTAQRVDKILDQLRKMINFVTTNLLEKYYKFQINKLSEIINEQEQKIKRLSEKKED